MSLIFHVWIIIVAIDMSPGDRENRDRLAATEVCTENHVTDIVSVSQRLRFELYISQVFFFKHILMKVKDTQQNKQAKSPSLKENKEKKIQCKNRMNRYHILFCKTTSLIQQDGGNISSPVCFVFCPGLWWMKGLATHTCSSHPPPHRN